VNVLFCSASQKAFGSFLGCKLRESGKDVSMRHVKVFSFVKYTVDMIEVIKK